MRTRDFTSLQVLPIMSLTFFGLCATPTAADDLRAGAMTADSQSVVASVAEYVDRILSLPSISLRYKREYEHVSGKRGFAFDAVQVSNDRQGTRLRTSVTMTKPVSSDAAAPKQGIDSDESRTATWDGETSMTLIATNVTVHALGSSDGVGRPWKWASMAVVR
jgi:hypothetical protein